jgi:hypothetical protein
MVVRYKGIVFETGHNFQDKPVIYCKSSGMEKEARVSLGLESVKLGSRCGDSHF